MTKLATEETFLRHQYVMNQGELPKKIYIVLSGEFEILRHKKNKYALIDPLKTDKLKQAKNLNDQ